MKFVWVLLSVATLAYSSPVPADESVLNKVIGNFVNCMDSDVNLCIKEHALRATERLGTVRKLKVFDGFTIINSEPREARSLETLSTVPEIRNKQVTERLYEKANELLQNSEFEINFGGDDEEMSGAEEVGRGLITGHSSSGHSGGSGGGSHRKKHKRYGNLMQLVKAKIGAMIVFFLGVIAASLWKLAVLAKVAFIAKIIALVKTLLAKKHQDHGWAPAHDDHGHGGWESQGWGRSRDEAVDRAYAAHKQE